MRQKKLVDQLPMEFMLPHTEWAVPTTLPDMTDDGNLAIDIETRDDGLANDRGPGWVHRQGFITGVTISSLHRSVYAPIRHPDTECLDPDAVKRWVKHHLLRPRSRGRKYFHNETYDLGWIWSEMGIDPVEDGDDTLGMAFMLDENRLRYNLDSVCEDYGVPGKDEWQLRAAAEAFGLNPKKEMWKLPARFVGPYAQQDGTATVMLGDKLVPLLEKDGLMDAYQLEADIIPLTMHMRKRGVRVNTSRAEQTMDSFLAKSREALDELGDKFLVHGSTRRWSVDDVRSPKFMAQVFTEHNVPYPQTEKGNDSFSNEWMSKREHDLPRLCARALQFHDAGHKFVGEYILGFTHMGRIHSEIHQFKGEDRGGTVTTRFSYSNPPLQQMPSRDEEIGPLIRRCFEPEEGEIWAAVDYSQQEFRLMVHFAKVCRMEGSDKPVQMYLENPNIDFHDMVAEITRLPRRRAKDVNFAKAFGAGPPKFALMTGMSLEEAKAAMAEYDSLLPFVSRLAEFCQGRADLRGYIRMIDGARGRFDRWEPRWTDRKKLRDWIDRCKFEGRPIPPLEACSLEEAQRRVADPDHPWTGRVRRYRTDKAMNKLIQGSAARQMKMAMRECWRERIIPSLQMHDELDLSVADPSVAERVGHLMQHVVKLVIPVKVDVEYGVNWGRAAKDKAIGHVPTWEAAVADRDSGEWV